LALVFRENAAQGEISEHNNAEWQTLWLSFKPSG
jgi:hypothetical protein